MEIRNVTLALFVAATLPVVAAESPRQSGTVQPIQEAVLRKKLQDLRKQIAALAPYVARVEKGQVIATQAVNMGPQSLCGPKGPVVTGDPDDPKQAQVVLAAVLAFTDPQANPPTTIGGGTPTQSCWHKQDQKDKEKK